MVVRLERDQNLGIHRPDIVAWHERQIECRWYADGIVDGIHLVRRNDLADAVFDLQHKLFGPLDPRARWGAEMQLDQPDISGGEEVQTDNRRQTAGHHQQQSGTYQYE